ncbi:hypothetical protein [Boseongicola aestuarii]|jgi:hypothetical protein|uniref:Uncharacterized protein n=1 Tax=Boseongicola aestuarii TaxID=1470561 RepID=A0A238IZJ8_9RHOB|nr:hypothetical protein [Boseongicola aestuarii]SMX23170.1 hypothetical protein BOA8489_01274 [Boseongicola aestuarii]
MSFIRPDAQATLVRWREFLIGMGLDIAGLVTVFGPTRANLIFGVLMMVLGSAMMFVGLQRARFRANGGGAGVVDVDERQISYFGPTAGGSVALEDLARIAVVPPHVWELSDGQGRSLEIPVDAEGGEALFDAFSALPGISASRLADATRVRPVSRTTVWEKPHRRLS